jgi:hypothetical protein
LFEKERLMRFVILTGGLVAFAAISIAGQSPKPAAAPSGTRVAVTKATGKAAVQRTPDGHPDLQGTWDFAQLTPFERPDAFKDKDKITDEEAEEFAQRRLETSNKDRRDGSAAADVERAYNDFWWDFGTRVAKQVSLVVDPADGRLPEQTPEARARGGNFRGRYENYEERPLAERCIVGFNSGPPMVPSAYNNNMQLVQTPDHVVIFNEMIHSARVVDLNRRTHQSSTLRFLTGDSIGRWEGDTLVVDTTNFQKDGGFRGATRNMHLIERFMRVDRDTLRYDFTVDDPATWTRSWTASIPMVRTDEQIFEYACHEGNYGLLGVLKGARYQDTQPPKQK